MRERLVRIAESVATALVALAAFFTILQYFEITPKFFRKHATIQGTDIFWVIAAALVLLGTLLFSGYRLYRTLPKAEKSSSFTPNDPDIQRLVRLAEHDDAHISERIYPLPGTTEEHLTAPEPYVRLIFRFVNASAFDLLYEALEANVRYKSGPLVSPLIPEWQTASPSMGGPGPILHGGICEIALLQFVPLNVAQEMRDRLKRNEDVVLETRPLAIQFGYINHRREYRIARVGVPATMKIGRG